MSPEILILGIFGILGKEAEKAARDVVVVYSVLILIIAVVVVIGLILSQMIR